ERADRLGHGRGPAGLRAPAPGVGDELPGLGAAPPVTGRAGAGPPLPRFPLLVLLHPAPALAFCGFYVGKADTQLFNESSQVALVRDGDRTVLTMSNDYRGPLTEFALVV